MSSPPLWKLAKPWTAGEWTGIVNSALAVLSLRNQARKHRRQSAVARRSGLGDACGDLQEAMRLEWKARGLEAHLRRNAEVRGFDLDAASVAAFCGD